MDYVSSWYIHASRAFMLLWCTCFIYVQWFWYYFFQEKCNSNLHIWKSWSKFSIFFLRSMLLLVIKTSLPVVFISYILETLLFSSNLIWLSKMMLPDLYKYFTFSPRKTYRLLLIHHMHPSYFYSDKWEVLNIYFFNMLTIYMTFHLVSWDFKIK